MEKFLLYLASSISQVVFRFSCCLSFSSCGTHFPIYWIFPMDFKRMETVSRVTFNWLLLSLSIILIQQFLQFCLQTFSVVFFVSHVKIAAFEFFKSLTALWFTKSMLTVSFDKHSMRFCSSFLQMVTENQCCPQIVISRHKIRHVQRYYKLYCCMKFVSLWVENLCLMPEQENGINGAVWRQLHWQPSIGKFRFHIYMSSKSILLPINQWETLPEFGMLSVQWLESGFW